MEFPPNYPPSQQDPREKFYGQNAPNPGSLLRRILLIFVIFFVVIGVFFAFFSSFIASFFISSLNSSFSHMKNVPGMPTSGFSIPAEIAADMETSQKISGDPTHFDPIIGLAQVREFAGADTKLESMELTYVSSDGTLNLQGDYYANAAYKFFQEVKNPTQAAPPIGAGGKPDGIWFKYITVTASKSGGMSHIKSMGGSVSLDYNFTNEGLTRDPSSSPDYDSPPKVLPDPKCSLTEFWKTAIAKGAPAQAVARITYDKHGYSFGISDANIYLNFDADCKLKK